MFINDILNSFGDSGRTFTSYLSTNDISVDQFNGAPTKLRYQTINEFLGYPEIENFEEDIVSKDIFRKFTLYRDAYENTDPKEPDYLKVLADMEVEDRNKKYPGMWSVIKMNINNCIRGLSQVRISVKDCLIPVTDALSIGSCVIVKIDPDLEYYRLKQIEEEILNKFWFMSIEKSWNKAEVPF